MSDKTELHQSQRILDAAFELISEKGYANVSLREIASEANVVLSQLNYYYKNKEGLLIEIIRMTEKKYLREIENVLSSETDSDLRMKDLIKYFQTMLVNDPKVGKLLFDLTNMAMWSNTFKNLLNELFDNIAKLIEKYILTDEIKDKTIKGYSTRTIARIIFGSLYGASIQVLLNPDDKDLLNGMNIIGSIHKT